MPVVEVRIRSKERGKAETPKRGGSPRGPKLPTIESSLIAQRKLVAKTGAAFFFFSNMMNESFEAQMEIYSPAEHVKLDR